MSTFKKLIGAAKVGTGLYTGNPSMAISGASDIVADGPKTHTSGGRTYPIQSSTYGMASEANRQIGDGLKESQDAYDEDTTLALQAYEEGEIEASDEILTGLGMSIEERTKFFDIAKDNVQWVVDFGQARKGNYSENMRSAEDAMGQSKQFLNQYKELIFNPDSIYDSEVYKSIKDRTVKEWGNFYSGKGLLGGNAQEAMVDRISDGAYNYLTGERNAALQGMQGAGSISEAYRNNANQELNAMNIGAGASEFQSDLAFKTGDANARDIMGAYGNLSDITLATNPGSLYADSARYKSDQIVDARGAQADASLAGNLGAASNRNNLQNSAIEAGSTFAAGALDSFLDRKKNTGVDGSAADAKATTASTFGSRASQDAPWKTTPSGGLFDENKYRNMA